MYKNSYWAGRKMSKPKKKTITKVEMVKAASRAIFGSVKPTQKVPNKRKKRAKYPHKIDED
jgi:hypothetical protein